MGSALAKNIAEETVNQSISSVNTAVTNCSAVYDVTSSINFSASNGGVIDINNLDCNFNNMYSVNTHCVGQTNISSSINSNISQQAALTATAISQNLDLNPGSTTAENIADVVSNLSFEIQNNIYNSCLTQATATQSLNLLATGPGSQVNVNGLVCNFSDTITAAQTCTFNNTISSQLTTSVEQAISEAASATVENALGWILMAIAIIVLVFFFFTLEAGTWIFIVLIILLLVIIVYIIIALIYSWWPFNRTKAVGASGALMNNTISLDSSNVSYTSSPFIPLVGSYQFVLRGLIQPTAAIPSPASSTTVQLSVNSTNSSNPPQTFTFGSDITEVISAPIQLVADSYTAILTLPSNTYTVNTTIQISSITSRLVPAPISISGKTVLANNTATPNSIGIQPAFYVTTTSPFELQVQQTSTTPINYSFTVTAPATTPPNLTTPPTLSIYLDPGSQTLQNNLATISYVIPPSPNGPNTQNPNAANPNISLTSIGTFTIPDNQQHSLICFVDQAQVQFLTLTIAPVNSSGTTTSVGRYRR